MLLSNLLLCLFSLSSYHFITSTKFCVNCKHFMEVGSSPLFAKCALFPKDYDKSYLVSGTKSISESFYYCSTARQQESLCGEEGKMFKRKI